MFLTSSIPVLFKNLGFYCILWGSPSAARGVQKPILTNVSENRRKPMLNRSRPKRTPGLESGFGQRKSNRRATAEQPPSNAQAVAEQLCYEPLPLPRDSSKEESKKNNREDRTEKTEARRQNTREAESQYDCMTVMTEGCNDCMLVMTVRL